MGPFLEQYIFLFVNTGNEILRKTLLLRHCVCSYYICWRLLLVLLLFLFIFHRHISCYEFIHLHQWSNYGGARGGLAHLKDLAAPAKHLF